jgi:hypothetical protein
VANGVVYFDGLRQRFSRPFRRDWTTDLDASAIALLPMDRVTFFSSIRRPASWERSGSAELKAGDSRI